MGIANDVAAAVLFERDQALAVHSVDNIDGLIAFAFALVSFTQLSLELLNQLTLLAKLSVPLRDLLAMQITLRLSFHICDSGVHFNALLFLDLCLSSPALRASFQEVSSDSVGS